MTGIKDGNQLLISNESNIVTFMAIWQTIKSTKIKR